jgi:hypothetical protein
MCEDALCLPKRLFHVLLPAVGLAGGEGALACGCSSGGSRSSPAPLVRAVRDGRKQSLDFTPARTSRCARAFSVR